MESSEEAVKEKLLLIDEELEVREILTAWLTASGYDVQVEVSGQAGLHAWQRHRHSVVICDLCAPDIDGLGFLKGVRETVGTDPAVQVIMITREGTTEDVVQAFRLGAADYLCKPLDRGLLEHVVRRCFVDQNLIVENQRNQKELELKNRELKESLRLLKEDQKAGQKVQLTMLPPTHKDFRHFTVDYKLIPSLYLSGDYIDYFQVSETRLAFCLADVSGHGASSAFVTVLLKVSADRLRQRYGTKDKSILDPASVLKLANDGLLSMNLGKHLAIFCGIIDLDKRQLTYATAAHFPPPLLVSGGKVEALGGSGLPVGIFKEPEYRNVTVELQETFRLILFSDGILEVMTQESVDEKEQFLLSMVKDGGHNIDTVMRVLGIDKVTGVPDDIAIMTVSSMSMK